MNQGSAPHPPMVGISAEGAELHVQRFSQDHERALLGPHGHQHLVLLYFERGGGKHRIGRHTWEVCEGDLYLIAPGEVHDLSRLANAAGWALEFAADVVIPETGRQGPSLLWHTNPLLYPFARSTAGEIGHFSVAEGQRPEWSRRFQCLDAELRARAVGYREASLAHLTLILVDVARLARDVTGHFRARDEPLLEAVFGFIEDHYAEPISLSDAAAAVHLTPGYLTTVIRRRTGRTVLDWITERRLAKARHLLISTDESVERVGELAGYRDPTYFIHSFKRAHGMTPAVWRRTNR